MESGAGGAGGGRGQLSEQGNEGNTPTDDTVYLEKEAERQEYVVCDFGLIWRGTAKRLRPCPWFFGQYEKDVLECVLEVLNNVCKMTSAHRNDPVKVSRALSAGVCMSFVIDDDDDDEDDYDEDEVVE